MYEMRVLPAGDAALLIELPQRIDPDVNAWAIALGRALQQRCGSALRDVVPAYCTVTVYFDPRLTDPAWITDQIWAAAGDLPAAPATEGAVVDVPVCYGGELGPDLPDVARFAQCSEADAIAIHSEKSYQVYLVGFVPGFAYMAPVDPRIAVPRRAIPRTAVPPGSVAIAGAQTGIYPSATPGGWNIVGRTPLKPFDPARRQPFLFSAGDQVRFHPITPAEFAALESA